MTRIFVQCLSSDALELAYGPPDPTKLTCVGLDESGSPVTVTFGQTALIQLTSALKKVEDRFPAALKGH